MAKIDPLRMLRWRLLALPRPPWMLLVFVVGDIVELAASLALAAASTPPPRPHFAVAALDVPFSAPAPTYAVAFLGIALGLLMGASLVGELWWMFRRLTIERRRYTTRARSPRPTPGAQRA